MLSTKMCKYRGIPHCWLLETERGMMCKYLRMVAMEKTRSPTLRKMTDNASPKLAGEYPTCSNYLWKSTTSLSRPQNTSIKKETKTPLQLLPYYFHHISEDYVEDLLATLTQTKTCSNTCALLLAHKPHKLGRKRGFRDSFIK